VLSLNPKKSTFNSKTMPIGKAKSPTVSGALSSNKNKELIENPEIPRMSAQIQICLNRWVS
jgi:hypothetical protein